MYDEDDELLDEEFEREIEEGFRDNMFCDNTGYCQGVSCRNYNKCHGLE